MNAIPIGDQAVIELADALSRVRALNDRESRMLQRAIDRGRGSFRRWTPQEDQQLLKMHKARIRCAEMATTLNRTEQSVFTRIRDLKKEGRAGRRPAK